MTKLTDTQVMRTPIVLCLFNRPDTTARVFSEIANVKPQQLYVVADGPRPDHPNDVGDCAKTRAIIDRIDWDCQVHRNFSDSNLGCTQRMATGIEWAFTHVEEAIILEDDCLPDPRFFRFCGELLERYRDDPRVMQIAGFNVPQDRRTQTFSYYFSKFATIGDGPHGKEPGSIMMLEWLHGRLFETRPQSRGAGRTDALPPATSRPPYGESESR